MFQELFQKMENEIRNGISIKEEYGNAMYMTKEEKKISFLNRYFIFRKVHSVDTESIYKIVQNRAATKSAESTSAETPQKINIVRTKKLKKKLVIPGQAEPENPPIEDIPMNTPFTATVRRPKNKGGAPIDYVEDIYVIAPSQDDVNEEELVLNVQGRKLNSNPITDAVHNTEQYLKTLTQGKPLSFVRENIRVSSNK